MSSWLYPYDWYPEHTPLNEGGPFSNIIAFCAEEVRRQGDSPWHVYRMYQAWMFAIEQYMDLLAKSIAYDGDSDYVPRITPAIIRECGSMIDELNEAGFRTTRIYIHHSDGRYDEKDRPEVIDSRIATLCEMQRKWEPDKLYKEFEEIHPFGDGNGRTGKIIFNWVNGTLEDPQWPHNFWDISNP